jgi:hypothetical protein
MPLLGVADSFIPSFQQVAAFLTKRFVCSGVRSLWTMFLLNATKILFLTRGYLLSFAGLLT